MLSGCKIPIHVLIEPIDVETQHLGYMIVSTRMFTQTVYQIDDGLGLKDVYPSPPKEHMPVEYLQ
jgi:hypothetical protein